MSLTTSTSQSVPLVGPLLATILKPSAISKLLTHIQPLSPHQHSQTFTPENFQEIYAQAQSQGKPSGDWYIFDRQAGELELRFTVKKEENQSSTVVVSYNLKTKKLAPFADGTERNVYHCLVIQKDGSEVTIHPHMVKSIMKPPEGKTQAEKEAYQREIEETARLEKEIYERKIPGVAEVTLFLEEETYPGQVMKKYDRPLTEHILEGTYPNYLAQRDRWAALVVRAVMGTVSAGYCITDSKLDQFLAQGEDVAIGKPEEIVLTDFGGTAKWNQKPMSLRRNVMSTPPHKFGHTLSDMNSQDIPRSLVWGIGMMLMDLYGLTPKSFEASKVELRKQGWLGEPLGVKSLPWFKSVLDFCTVQQRKPPYPMIEWPADYQFPDLVPADVGQLIRRLLDTNEETRMTLPQLLERVRSMETFAPYQDLFPTELQILRTSKASAVAQAAISEGATLMTTVATTAASTSTTAITGDANAALPIEAVGSGPAADAPRYAGAADLSTRSWSVLTAPFAFLRRIVNNSFRTIAACIIPLFSCLRC